MEWFALAAALVVIGWLWLEERWEWDRLCARWVLEGNPSPDLHDLLKAARRHGRRMERRRRWALRMRRTFARR